MSDDEWTDEEADEWWAKWVVWHDAQPEQVRARRIAADSAAELEALPPLRCITCDREIAAGEYLTWSHEHHWRDDGEGDQDLFSWRSAPLCQDCAPRSTGTYAYVCECDLCGREFGGGHGYRSEDHFCSDPCERIVERVRRRVEPTRHACTRCGEDFAAKASARFCSPRCRQAAYRERQRSPA